MDEYPVSPTNGDDLPTTPFYPDAPVGPTQPDVATPPPPPTASTVPWVQRNLLLAIVAGVVVLALLITGVVYAASHGLGSSPPNAASIIANANKANLKDASYAIQDKTAVDFGATGSPVVLDIKGTGKLTKMPNRNDITLNVSLLGQVPIEVLTDGNTGYLNLGALSGILGGQIPGFTSADSGKWLKVPLGSQSVNLLDYSHLTNLKYIGSDKINGKATWHIQGTLSAGTVPTPTAGSTAKAQATTEDLWFFQDTYFPAQFQLQASANLAGLPLPGLTGNNVTRAATPTPAPAPSEGTSDATLTFTNWNSGLTITPPDPGSVVSLPAGAITGK